MKKILYLLLIVCMFSISNVYAEEITEETKDEVMQAIQNAYWKAKKENEKYTPKKYRKEE